MKNRFPRAWEYLSQNRARLIERSGVSRETWWQYGRPQNLDAFEKEKLMTQVLASEASFALDDGGSFVFVGGGNAGGYGVVTSPNAEISDLALVAILNSSLFDWKVKKESSQFRGGYYSYARRYIERLPICIDKLQTDVCDVTQLERAGSVAATLEAATNTIVASVERREQLDTHLPDYLGSYRWGASLKSLSGLQLAPGVSESILVETTRQKEKLRIGTVTVERTGDRIVLEATARYKPENDDQFDTDRWGYTETDPVPAFEFVGLDDREMALIEAFVPLAVEKAGGFANFRESAAKTHSLVGRLRELTLPALNDVSDQLEAYVESRDRERELNQRIREAEETIDSVVYGAYGIGPDEQRIIESALDNG